MSSKAFKNLAKQHGFSKVLGSDKRRFVLLDRDTDGRSGKAIFINADLAQKFFAIGEQDIEMVFARLKQLRALASGLNSSSNAQDAADYFTPMGSVGVRYKVFLATGDSSMRPGVYITDIELGSFGSESPGLYKVTKGRDEWLIDKRPVDAVDTELAAVNGLCDDIQQAATKLMPDMLKNAYSEGELGGSYTLCYNPPSVYRWGRIWKSRQQESNNSNILVQHLSQALVNAQRKNKKVKWVVHGDGIKLFHKALESLPGETLNQHSVIFLAPTQALSGTLALVAARQMGVHKDVMKIGKDDFASRKHQMRDGKAVENVLKEMPSFSNGLQGSKMAMDAERDFVKFSGLFLSVGAGVVGAGAFLVAPALPAVSTVLNMVAGAGALKVATSALKAYHQAQTMRNLAVNHTTDANLNPHFHPFKDETAMHAHALSHSGSMGKTFRDAIKAIIKV